MDVFISAGIHIDDSIKICDIVTPKTLMLNRRQLLVVAAGKAALHYAPVFAEEKNVARRTALISTGGTPEDIEYDVLGDLSEGTRGMILLVLHDGLFGRGIKFQHREVINAMREGILCLALRNNFDKKKTAMDRARISKAVLDTDRDFKDVQSIVSLGVSAGGEDAIATTALLGQRVKMCVLLSAQGDLSDKRYARFTPRDDLSRLQLVCSNLQGSSLRETSKRSAVMRLIKGMSQSPDRLLETSLKKLPERDVTLIANDPELKELLLQEFTYYCDGTPSEEQDKTRGHRRIENSIKSLFEREVPWENIPKETEFKIWHYEEDSLVDSRNSKLLKEDLEQKSGNRRTELTMLPGDSHFGYFEKNGPLPAIVEAIKKGMR